jgi:preprotein translocase subunit SecA
MIVDEQTGRIMDGRRYSDGLHQPLKPKNQGCYTNFCNGYFTKLFQNIQQTRRNEELQLLKQAEYGKYTSLMQ